jgi:uncharacterized protein (TIGR02118 family)
MAKLVVLYNPPQDSGAFESYYIPKHIPLVRKIPGVRKIEVSTGPVVTPDGPSPYHLVAMLSFDSLADLQTGVGSTEGQEAVADLANFATGGATVLIFEHHEV